MTRAHSPTDKTLVIGHLIATIIGALSFAFPFVMYLTGIGPIFILLGLAYGAPDWKPLFGAFAIVIVILIIALFIIYPTTTILGYVFSLAKRKHTIFSISVIMDMATTLFAIAYQFFQNDLYYLIPFTISLIAKIIFFIYFRRSCKKSAEV